MSRSRPVSERSSIEDVSARIPSAVIHLTDRTSPGTESTSFVVAGASGLFLHSEQDAADRLPTEVDTILRGWKTFEAKVREPAPCPHLQSSVLLTIHTRA